MGGTSCSFRGGGKLGRLGGGERSRGETGQRGVSLRCSAWMGDFWGPEPRAAKSVDTGPSLGTAEADILPEDEAVCAVALDIRVGLLSWGVLFRDLGALVGAEADLFEPERASGLL